MDIKSLKPSKKSRYQQGYIDPSKLKKYADNKPIIYRSSYEYKFIVWCERNKDVISWGSEIVQIPYLTPDGKKHTYNPDFIVKMNDGTYLVEIKPSNQTKKPINENGWLQKEWIRNNCKWEAALRWCEERGLKFKIVTEKSLC